jgi:hypothetical protein
MNTTEFKGDWAELKRKIRKEFAELTNEELKFSEVQKEAMLKRLQITMGKTKEELNKIINQLNSVD